MTMFARAYARKFTRGVLSAMWLAIVVGIPFILLSGCAALQWEKIPAPVAEALAGRKAESIRDWEPVIVDGTTLVSMLDRGTPMIVSSSASVSMDLERLPDDPGDSTTGTTTWGFSLEWTLEPGQTWGAAAVVANDGYFLTAGHVVDEPPLDVIAFVENDEGDPQFQRAPIRVVWAPGNFANGPDIAVVHAEVGSLEALKLANEPLGTDDQIVTGGWPIMHLQPDSGRSRLSAGRILSVTRRDAMGSSPAFVELRHDAPLVPGDSGGPVLDGKGHLLGINSRISVDVSFWQWLVVTLGRVSRQVDIRETAGEAIMPDPAWLRQVIENDRLRSSRPSESPTMRP